MDRIPQAALEQISRALGEAVIRMWGRLPTEIQHEIFEEVVTVCGETMRPQLAIFLHDKHPRTAASMVARAMLEPDSLGG